MVTNLFHYIHFSEQLFVVFSHTCGIESESE
jgi:hypothetical protein